VQHPGHVDHRKQRITALHQSSPQASGAVDMQQVLVPAPFDHLRDQNGDASVAGLPLEFTDEIQDGFMDGTALSGNEDQARRLQTGLAYRALDEGLPLLLQLTMIIVIGSGKVQKMHGNDIGGKTESHVERLVGELVPTLQHD